MNPKVSIIILNWNGKEDTLECLQSLQKVKYDNLKLFVVDNGSTDHSVTALQERFPQIDLIALDKNYGFAEGNNIGIRTAQEWNSDYFLLLNNDTVVEKNCLHELLKVAERYQKGGIFGAKTYLYGVDGKVLYPVGMDFNFLTGKVIYYGWNEVDKGQYNEVREFDVINGHAFLIKKVVVEKIGMLDPQFFAYNEETDYCIRASKAGLKMIYVPKAVVFHKGERAPVGELRQYLIKRNHLLCMRKNASRFQLFLFYLYFFFFGLPKQILTHVLKRQWSLLVVTLKAVGWNFGFWINNNPLTKMRPDLKKEI